MVATTFQTRRLRYRGECSECGMVLAPGIEAQWHPVTRQIRCLACARTAPAAGAPADPFTVAARDVGAAGRSVEGCFGRNGKVGAEGERKLGSMLDAGADGAYLPIHDRRVPGSRGNIDHLAVAPRGVYVIDAKKWSGRVEWVTRDFRRRVLVGGRDRTGRLAETLAWQAGAVQEALDRSGHGDVPLHRVVCFVDAEWPLLQPAFRVAGLLVTPPRALVERLGRDGPLTYGRRRAVAVALAAALPPA
ncbi:MAG: NERD domain-containing protein [Actinobacteria bacterium]|nr:NERD domain-containing protein [Actinomycetota bacterium]